MELWSPAEMEVHLGENQIDTIHPRRLYAREPSVRLQKNEEKIMENKTKIEYTLLVLKLVLISS